MKKYALSIAFASLCLSVQAQNGVGINTENPQGLFHVAAGQDVVIGNTGNVGVGVTAPTAKLHVAGAVQIIDGLQQDGHLLISDSAGNARWGWPIGSAGRVEAVLELDSQDIAPSTYTDIPGSAYAVQADGYHVFEIRWYAAYASPPSRRIHTATHFQLKRKDVSTAATTVADEYEMWRNISTDPTDAVTIWTTLSTHAKAGDTLRLVVRPSTAHSTLYLRKADKLTTSKIIVKRLNVR